MATTNANDAYAAAREKVHSQIIRLQNLLNAHTTKQKTAPANWGYAGDLNRVVEILDGAIEFLGGDPHAT